MRSNEPSTEPTGLLAAVRRYDATRAALILAKAALRTAKEAHTRAALDLYQAAAGVTQPELPLPVDGDD